MLDVEAEFRGEVVDEDYERPSGCLSTGEDSVTVSG